MWRGLWLYVIQLHKCWVSCSYLFTPLGAANPPHKGHHYPITMPAYYLVSLVWHNTLGNCYLCSFLPQGSVPGVLRPVCYLGPADVLIDERWRAWTGSAADLSVTSDIIRQCLCCRDHCPVYVIDIYNGSMWPGRLSVLQKTCCSTIKVFEGSST